MVRSHRVPVIAARGIKMAGSPNEKPPMNTTVSIPTQNTSVVERKREKDGWMDGPSRRTVRRDGKKGPFGFAVDPWGGTPEP
jgi:hypothetical protein